MRKTICSALLLLAAVCWLGSPVLPVAAAAPKTPTVAVVLLGSLEFQNSDYYEIATESLLKKFPADKYRLFVGEYPQRMFNRFSDKQSLLPGEMPTEEILAQFSWSHSFDEVIFILLSAPSIKSNEITIQWENAEVTITARILRFESRTRKKLADVTSTQTIKTLSRSAAKKATFRKCLDALRDQL